MSGKVTVLEANAQLTRELDYLRAFIWLMLQSQPDHSFTSSSVALTQLRVSNKHELAVTEDSTNHTFTITAK